MEPTAIPETSPPNRMATRQGGRLRAAVVPVAAVDEQTRLAAWELFQAAYSGADQDRFDRDLSAKDRVILLRAAHDGSLRGFSTVQVARADGGAGATVVYSGDTVIDPAYWGTKLLQRAFAALLAREKLRRPAQPVYWFLVSKGYKTYLMLAHAFPQAIPRRDGREDPELRRVLDAVARARFGADYDPATGVIRHAVSREHVREGLCPVDDRLRGDPDVAFFARRNPGHADGDELACLARVRARDLLRTIVRSWWHASRWRAALRRRRRGDAAV